MDLCGEKETIGAVIEWNKMAMLHDHIIVYNFTAWPYSEETLSLIKGNLFNAVIMIGKNSDQIFLGQYFKLLRSDWIENKRDCGGNLVANHYLQLVITTLIPVKIPCIEVQRDFLSFSLSIFTNSHNQKTNRK